MRRVTVLLLAALALTACGTAPTATKAPARSLAGAKQPAAAQQPTTGMPMAAGAVDPRVTTTLGLVQHLRDTSSTASSTIMFNYISTSGTKEWMRSKYKYMKPRKNFVTLVTGSDSKAEGTELAWTGDGQVQVHTKFIGFWMNVGLDITDDRLKDPCGYQVNQTAVDKVFDTLLTPQARVTFKADGQLAGHAITVLDVVSPLSLKGTTREVFGIDKATGTPLLREMYKGDQKFYSMSVESNVMNPKLTGADFQVD